MRPASFPRPLADGPMTMDYRQGQGTTSNYLEQWFLIVTYVSEDRNAGGGIACKHFESFNLAFGFALVYVHALLKSQKG